MSENICPIHDMDDLICGVAVGFEEDILRREISSLQSKLTDIERDRQGLREELSRKESGVNWVCQHYFGRTLRICEECFNGYKALQMIASMCGNPDAKEGCRLILRECDDALNTLRIIKRPLEVKENKSE